MAAGCGIEYTCGKSKQVFRRNDSNPEEGDFRNKILDSNDSRRK